MQTLTVWKSQMRSRTKMEKRLKANGIATTKKLSDLEDMALTTFLETTADDNNSAEFFRIASVSSKSNELPSNEDIPSCETDPIIEYLKVEPYSPNAEPPNEDTKIDEPNINTQPLSPVVQTTQSRSSSVPRSISESDAENTSSNKYQILAKAIEENINRLNEMEQGNEEQEKHWDDRERQRDERERLRDERESLRDERERLRDERERLRDERQRQRESQQDVRGNPHDMVQKQILQVLQGLLEKINKS